MQLSSTPKIVLIGTPKFGAIILERLIKYMPSFRVYISRGPYSPILIVTTPDRIVGRNRILTSPAVKVLAEKYRIPILQPEKIKNMKYRIKVKEPDLIVVAAYGKKIPKDILLMPKFGCLNVHPSLLPKYRGPSPIQYAILNGDKETGVTIMSMNDKIDQGDIVAVSKFEIKNPKITSGELSAELANLGAKLLIKTIPQWIEGKIKPVLQDNLKATDTKIITKKDGKINWKKSAKDIERQIRAFDPWPGTFFEIERPELKFKTAKVIKASVLKQKKIGPFGIRGKTFLASNSEIAVQTGKDFLIIEELQPEGKRKMAAAEFLKGHQNFIGNIFT